MAKQPRKDKQEAPLIDYDAFRDHIGTVDEQGKRNWIYPKKPSGWFHNRRLIVSIVLLGMLFTGPFLRMNGQSMFLFNVLERKFIIFGLTFWPQDFHLFVLAMLTFMVFVVLFTAVFGRVWCGWACPQTIFMEMVFRKIEYAIEGDRVQQVRLNKSPWNMNKIIKKGSKLLIFYAISLLIANTLMAYLVGLDELKLMVTHPPAENWGKFVGVMIFSGIFFFVFTYLREQACIVICPYGRLQGAMLDKNSIVVAYDNVRGEPRERIKRGEDRSAGDCVSCSLCVQVCPTGIDIKDGTQMECVNCTACMDACDDVMDKVGFEKGLIRYASINNIEQGEKFSITPRILAYSAVLVALIAILGFSLGSRADVETTFNRTRGTLYQQTEDNHISNLYTIQIVNKTIEDYPITFELKGLEGRIKMVGTDEIVLGRQGIYDGALFIEIPREALSGMKNKITVEVWSGKKMLDSEIITFLGPLK